MPGSTAASKTRSAPRAGLQVTSAQLDAIGRAGLIPEGLNPEKLNARTKSAIVKRLGYMPVEFVLKVQDVDYDHDRVNWDLFRSLTNEGYTNSAMEFGTAMGFLRPPKPKKDQPGKPGKREPPSLAWSMMSQAYERQGHRLGRLKRA